MTDLARLHELVLVPGALDLAGIARAFTDLLDADGAILFQAREDDLVVGGAHPPNAEAEASLCIPIGYGVVGLVAQNCSSVTIVDDTPRNVAHRALLGLSDGEVVSRLCVPARGLAGEVVGVVSVHRRTQRPFDQDEMARTQRVGDLVGLRMHAERLLGVAEEHRTQRDRLIAQAISAQEAERRRIAGDLHDGVTQALASLAFQLSAAHTGLTAALGRMGGHADADITGALVEIGAAKQLAGLAYDETRAAITGLHSLLLEDLGLVAALESLAQSVPQIAVEFRHEAVPGFDSVPDHAAAALFRIAQEALNNAVKHSGAGHSVVSLRRVGDAIVLAVTDDGVGFDVASVRQAGPSRAGEHFGLSSIVERCALIGATLRIDSVEGRGTAVIVELPL